MGRTIISWAWLFTMALGLTPAWAGTVADKIMIVEAENLPGLTWHLEIDYVTSVNDVACKFENPITGLWDAQVVSERVSPVAAGGRLTAAVPLVPAGQEVLCGWKLNSVSLCPANAAGEGPSCATLFISRAGAEALPQSIALTCDIGRASCLPPTSYAASYFVSDESQPHLELKLRPAAR